MNNTNVYIGVMTHNLRMGNKLIIIPILFLFLLTFVSAGTLTLVPSNDPYFVFNETQDFRIHTFYSDGGNAPDSDLTCAGRLTDTDGNGYGISKTSTSSTYSKFTISSGLLDYGDTVSYAIWCSSTATSEKGFVSGTLYLTSDSEYKEPKTGILVVIILIPLIMAFLLILSSMMMGDEHKVFRILTFWFVFPLTWLSYHFSTLIMIKYTGFPEIQKPIALMINITSWFLYLTIAYFLIFILYTAIKKKKKKDKAMLEY